MDETEIARHTSQLPAHYQARLNPDTYADINRSVRVGEWAEALEQLVAALHQTNVPITTQERDELNDLFIALDLFTDPLDALTVTD